MDIYSRLIRRTLVGLSILAILMLAFGVFNPYNDATIYIRLLLLIPASVLAAGLIPGSYILKLIDAFAARPQLGSPIPITLLTILGLLFLAVVAALGAFDQVYMLQLIQELDLSFINSREVRYQFVRFSVLGIAAFVLFIWNAFDLLRARSSARTA